MTTSKKTVKELDLDVIRIDGGTQPRAAIDLPLVAEYSEAMELGETFPPVDVFHDGKQYWLADGFHRYHAAAKANLPEITATIHKGTQRDAVLYSVGANAVHGLRRTNEDKRHAVLMLLNDEEWSKKSQRWIAEKCGVSHQFVANMQEELSTVDSWEKPTTTIGRDGKERPATRLAASKNRITVQPAINKHFPPSNVAAIASVIDDPDVIAEANEPVELFRLKSLWLKTPKRIRKAFAESLVKSSFQPDDGGNPERIKTSFDLLKEKINKAAGFAEQMAAERLGHTPKSAKVVEQLQETLKAVEMWRRSVEKK